IRAIKAHALLHREQRARDDQGQIIADIEHDYAAVRGLMSAILAEGSGTAIKETMQETITAVEQATAGLDATQGASAQDIAKVLKLDKSAARRRLVGACADGWVVNLEQRRGMPGKYRTTDQTKVDRADILPGVDALMKAYTPQPPPESPPPCHPDG